MRRISAKIIDPTHLELTQPLQARTGDVIEISLLNETEDEMAIWRYSAKQHLLKAYADEDAIYDEL